MTGITFRGSDEVAAVRVISDDAHVTIEACHFVSNPAAALMVTDGHVHVSNSRFELNGNDQVDGGAVVLGGGTCIIVSTTFHANVARNGGAMLVRGPGLHWLAASTFTSNTAYASGGALFAVNSSLTLGNGTLVDETNKADRGGNSIQATSAHVVYALPAPNAHWIANNIQCQPDNMRGDACAAEHMALTIWRLSPTIDDRVPLLCAPGVVGSTANDETTQISQASPCIATRPRLARC